DSINIEMSNIPTFSELLAAPIFSQNYTPLNLALTHNIMEQSLDTEMSNMPMFSEPLSKLLLENTVPVFSQSLNLVSTYNITEPEQLSDIEISNNMLSESLIESLPKNVAPILPQNYNYIVSKFQQFPNYITPEEFSIDQFEIDFFVNVNNIEGIQQWFSKYEEISKTMMPKTKSFQIQGKKVIHQELRHCIHKCTATIHIRLERWRLQTTHPLEVNIKYTYNHIVYSAESLSFRRVRENVRNNYLELFANEYSPATAWHTYEDMIYLGASNDQELVQLLADRAQNPDYGYVLNLFQQYRNKHLGGRNGITMFQHLKQE
ncbi:22394_t:CDS:2, partial [Dentiscutata erythropus]